MPYLPASFLSASSREYVRPVCGAVVKLQSIAVKSGGAEGRAPRRVKLFINNASLGFSEASDFPAVQEFELTKEQAEEGLPIALKCVLRN